MNILLIGIDNLPYNSIKFFNTESKSKTTILDSIAQQSSCFHNFRLPSPNAGLNLNQIANHFASSELENPLFFIEGDPKENFESIKKNVIKKDYFVFYRIKNDTPFADDHSSHIIRVENQLKTLIDFWDEKKYLNSKTVMVIVGLSGNGKGEHPHKIFENETLDLYDENIQTPLMIHHPNTKIVNATNSISLDMLLTQLLLWKQDKYFAGNLEDILKNKKNTGMVRQDIYSSYKNYCSLRGPMFHYFIKFDKTGRQLGHELYDLNNDYEMKNDLAPKLHTLNTQIVDLAQVYKKRLWDRFKDTLF